MASVAAYVPLTIWGLATWDRVDLAVWAWMVGVVPLMVAVGVVMLIKRPENPIGELATWAGLIMFLIPALPEIPTTIIYEESGAEGWMWAGMWLAMTAGVVGFILLMALVVTLPNGRIQHRRETRFLWIAAPLALIPTLSLFSNEFVYTHTQSFVGVDDVRSPFFVPALETFGPAVNILGSLAYALFIWAVVLQVMRYRHASDRERKQVRWVLYGGAVAIVLGVIPSLLETLGMIAPLVHGSLGSLIVVPTFFIFMGSILVAVLEPPWVDVDIVIRKSFVYGLLSFLILLLYIGAAAAFGVVAAGARLDIEIAVVLTVVVAVLFQPARHRLQVIADRWVFGARPTRFEAVAEFGETIEDAADPSELLPRLVETIRKAIRLEWVEATLDDGTRAGSGVRTADTTLSVSIGLGSEKVGLIECGPKVNGSIDNDETHLVQTLAAQVGLAVLNARLAGRILNAAEAERRRIERNIHDGAQQELVALVARLGMAKTNAARGDLSPETIEELQAEAQHILSDVRELAQGIHPSVLTDGGILEAVEERCTHIPIDVSVRASEALRTMRFDDDVEGAAYFFVSETLANALKHAGASRIEVTLDADNEGVRLGVTDDGCGFNPSTDRSNGLIGLGDRIRALGGTITISSRAEHGTSVQAAIPTSRP